ncbi:hypothetical protein ACOMHN_010963 [Nucella lapillus]
MASTASLSALLAFFCLYCLNVSTVSGVKSRTRHSSESVLTTLEREFSADRYFSPHVHDDHRSIWTRHKRAARTVNYQAPAVPEDRKGYLFSVSSTISDADLRTFTLVSTSVGDELVTVDSRRGRVGLAEGQHLDFENDAMVPLTILIQAVRMRDPSDVVIINATMAIQDLNDEHPVFRNAPAPYLATVAATAAAGAEIYELYASDDDADSQLDYQLVSADPEEYKDRFEVVTERVEVKGYGPIYKGYLRTKGSGRYPDNKEIKVDVSARDVRGDPSQLTVMTVRVLVGVRPPQFYEDPYYGFMFENSATMQMVTQQDGKELKISTVKFQKGKIRYELYDDASQQSSVFTIDNEGRIFNLQVLDYESVDRSLQPLQYRLVLWVHEDLDTKTLSNNATLIITVQDVNDHKPDFDTAHHFIQVAENLAIHEAVTEVTAEDKDSGVNAELEYSVDSEFFYVETKKKDAYTYSGIIKVKKKLDFDRNPGHLYELIVYATDKGTPPKSSFINVRVKVTNVNDEAPEFQSKKIEIDVDENAAIGTVIAIIQAVDKDGDAVTYYFSPRRIEHEVFRINPDSGLITLARSVLGGADFYTLNITAYDDGSCCSDGNRLSTESFVIVRVVDINTHKPTFDMCSDYSKTKIREHLPIGAKVVQVKASDQDRGENGKVRYGIVSPIDNTFVIGREDGVIAVGRDIDREVSSDKYIQVTVNATDGADPPLDGWCTFRVEVEDINDNRPKFDRSEYMADITSDTQQGHPILTVRAYDSDIGSNGEIEYSLLDDAGVFGVIGANGVIILKNSLLGQTSYKLTVMAKDKGAKPLNSTATVTISVAVGTSNPPVWDKNYDTITYEVSETAIATNIATMRCDSEINDERVEFQIIREDGSSSQSTGTFSITYDRNTLYLNVDGKLDYETISSYTVRLRCLNFGPVTLMKEVNPTIKLIDKNDELPYFQGTNRQGRYPGSVPENLPPGQDVITITGYDNDVEPRFSNLTFSLERANEDFEIVPGPSHNTAIIRTKSTFDREKKSYYDLTVMAKDSVNSDRQGHMPRNTPNSARVTVEVFIKDQNDNAPYFKKPLYVFTVPEDQYIDTAFAFINAEDPDETDRGRLNYIIVDGNAPLYKFGMKSATGGLFVAKTLDYESYDRFFELTLNASDGLHTNSTFVQVTVLDANDNAPEFIDTPYRIEDRLVEEDKSVIEHPKLLLTVLATDRDTDRPNNITYSLQGYGTEPPNQYFRINPITGDLYVINPLDRDTPNGRSNYQFTVVAKDEPTQPWQFGYATVEVLPADVNDNKPTFDTTKLKGSVPEHSQPGTSVMFVLATDPDRGHNGSVVYDIIKNSVTVGSKQDYFVIDRRSGLIRTNVHESDLDRETIPSFTLEVRASDEGKPPLNTTATITITLDDINDQKPVFDPKIYSTTMSENQKSGEVTRVGATDADMGNNAKLTYRLDDRDSKFFQIITIDNMGSILVYGEVDYEQANQQFFNLTVIAEDPEPMHTATAYVAIKVLDFNDNAPAIKPQVITKEIFENEPAGYHVATFNATDMDSGDNAKFEFSIDRHTDPRRHFSIHPENGRVTLRRPLDRETQDRHTITIRAIDKGDPPMTGYGTLTVIVKDINDNFPQFLKNYQPQVREGDDRFPAVLQKILGKDPDAFPYGAPFGFASPVCEDGTDRCPCDARPTCEFFDLVFDPTGDRGNGTATISTRQMFDREKQKYYYIPIVMWDMRGKNSAQAMTGTNTLTVTIADVNDNVPKAGHQDIFVYNYKGTFGPLEIGRVYVEDDDDWDLADKTFTFAEPSWLKDYFSVNRSNGMVTMKKGVPSNTPERPKFEFKVDVYDAHWNLHVRSTVSVTVQTLSEEAVANSGAIRITGTTAEEFIIKDGKRPSKKEKFHKLLADVLGLPQQNVDIITVMDMGKFTDVRYAAHGSPYYQASQTDSAVVRNQKMFEEEVGISVMMVPIDACAEEQFEDGCFNYMDITGQPAMVNANGTSFVGVEVFIVAMAGCRALAFPDPNTCTGEYCYHGGTCRSDDWGVLSCACPPGFDGPRCQQRRHSFDGDSYAFFPTLEQCEESQTTIEFITLKDDGLLLYNGPIGEINVLNQPEDFISLELLGGYPRLMINHGTGTQTLTLDGRDKAGTVIMRKLSDGVWHRIDIVRSGKDVEMIVDYCRAVHPEQDVQVDTSSCSIKKRTPGENTFLNVNTLLQLGGRYANPSYPTGITDKKFDGCIRNLVHNGKLYDLYYKPTADFNSGFNGCPREDELCGIGEEEGSMDRCGENGKCTGRWDLHEATCVCDSGWRGKKCHKETTVRNLKKNSHFRWTLNRDFFSTRVSSEELEIQMMFRTRDENGVLFTASSTDNTQTITLEIFEGHVRVLYNLGDGEQQLQLSGPPASDGQWHTVNAKRVLQQMTLILDGGEGRNYNFSRGSTKGKVNLVIQRLIFAGASVSYSQEVRVLTGDLTDTCVQDIRLNNGWFPMDFSENSDQDAVAELKENPNMEEGCVREDCLSDPCTDGRHCYPLWEDFECRCLPGYHEVDGECISDCIPNPCFNNVSCRIELGMVICQCPPDKIGEFCREPTRALTSSVTTPGIVAIVVSAFVVILLLLLVFMLVKFRRSDSDNDKYILEVDPEDDIRENVINYDEEGAGEEDQDAYDMSRLQKTDLDPLGVNYVSRRDRPLRNAPGDKPDVGDFITERMSDADNDPVAPPHDSVMEFAFEGLGSDAGSLSSLNTSSSADSADYDYLNEWGPKFTRLAEMYGAGEEDD